ncbi:hypothetical protein, variant [Aphanomyces astaci]|uniref:Uncharacterized protein n=1 Tax=Aphanomyces astaci TaxID=112090 RepID=W4GR89_APHAT|nr:hypothetical protein, variant [Aphanomyces astaci]ETV82235.1 hypothetical protein, variant [Aphanomyces astaci]|eukprot:XP_009827904.1 hypothetical protein, variant [Aphanomyces astaci]
MHTPTTTDISIPPHEIDAMLQEVATFLWSSKEHQGNTSVSAQQQKPKRKWKKRTRMTPYTIIQRLKGEVEVLTQRRDTLVARSVQTRHHLNRQYQGLDAIIGKLQCELFSPQYWALPLDSSPSTGRAISIVSQPTDIHFHQMGSVLAKYGLVPNVPNRLIHSVLTPVAGKHTLVYAQTNYAPAPAATYANVYWNTFTRNLPLQLPGLRVELLKVLDMDTMLVQQYHDQVVRYIQRRYQVSKDRTVFVMRSIDHSDTNTRQLQCGYDWNEVTCTHVVHPVGVSWTRSPTRHASFLLVLK